MINQNNFSQLSFYQIINAFNDAYAQTKLEFNYLVIFVNDFFEVANIIKTKKIPKNWIYFSENEFCVSDIWILDISEIGVVIIRKIGGIEIDPIEKIKNETIIKINKSIERNKSLGYYAMLGLLYNDNTKITREINFNVFYNHWIVNKKELPF